MVVAGVFVRQRLVGVLLIRMGWLSTAGVRLVLPVRHHHEWLSMPPHDGHDILRLPALPVLLSVLGRSGAGRIVQGRLTCVVNLIVR